MILKDSAETRERAAQVIAAGGLLAFRTDTFYGLGADPFNRDALSRIFSLKDREERKPILVIIGERDEAERFIMGETRFFRAVSEKHWPGALTLVVRARADVPKELTAGTGTIGVRLPDDADVRRFVRACGGALTATSANLSGQPPARSAADVARYFPQGLDLIVDGGTTSSEQPSTVLDVSEDFPRMIREGAVSKDELEQTFQEM